MKKLLYFLGCGIIMGCGNTELYPYDPSTNSFLDKPSDPSALAVFVTDKTGWGGQYPIAKAVLWDSKRKPGLEGKQIYISVYPRTNTIWGDALIGGTTCNLYLLSTDTTLDVVATILHEDDHLRGLDHEHMPDYVAYVQLATNFLNTLSSPHRPQSPHLSGPLKFSCGTSR